MHAGAPIGVGTNNVVGTVVSSDSRGDHLFGRDCGVFGFADARDPGSSPGLGVRVDDVVGAVPT